MLPQNRRGGMGNNLIINIYSLTFSVNIIIFAVKITYKTNKLEKQLTVAKEMQKAFGKMAKKVNQRIKELSAIDNVEHLKTIPAARCHELKGEKKGEFAVDISGNYRIIFEPDHNPIPLKEDSSIDCIRITDIKILGTEDYH